MAVNSAAQFKNEFPASENEEVQLWIDDTEEERLKYEQHIKSPEYRELHKPAMTTSAMGLFGGEPGFEKSHRVWVDPDRPQMKHIYNQTALAKNLRYTRYGYFKRDMHLLDIDKLVRHARMLPTPNRLLTDFLYQRVPLPDKSSAAFLRYQKDQLELLEEWQRPSSFSCAEEIFERLCVTNIPPVEVGVETHAEMIRCCAVCKEWKKGYEIYLTRAREIEEDDVTNEFVLDTNIFDAVLQLCVACEKPNEGLAILQETIERYLRPRASMLDKAMILVSQAQEQLLQVVEKKQFIDNTNSLEDAESVPLEEEKEESRLIKQGLDVWSLYDFYKLPRTTESFEAYIRMCAMMGKPLLAIEAVSLADATSINVSLECYYWTLYAIHAVPDFGDYVLDIFGRLAPRGLSPDYILFTLAFGYCAVHREGHLAYAIYSQYFVDMDMNPTPEMVLLYIQACARSEEPSLNMLSSSEALVERLEAVGSSKDKISEIYDQLIDLAASLGAVSTAFSRLKLLVSYGKGITTRQLNSLLLATSNAEASSGGPSMVLEVYNLFRVLQLVPNEDTLQALIFCKEKFDLPELVEEWALELLAAQEESKRATDAGVTEPSASRVFVAGGDAEIDVEVMPPHKIRRLRTEWKLRPRDTMLRRFGQHTKPRPEEQVGSMLGSVVPFGRSPGERMV